MEEALFAAMAALLPAASAGVPGWDDPVLYPPEVGVDDAVGAGQLRVGTPDENGMQQVMVLEATSVSAVVSAGLVDVTLTQWFRNPSDVPIEATYLLPLPEGAAVNRMRLTCGDRVVDGFVAERAAARELYESARAAGVKVALLEQHRDNLFRQSISNVCPGEEVQIELGWIEQAALEDGVYSWTMPLTVGPRYSPPWVDDAAELLNPTRRTGRRVDVNVAIEEGLPVAGLWSDTHDVAVVEEGDWGAEVELAEGSVTPDSDFSLEWTLGGEGVAAALVVDPPTDDHDGTFALSVEPPGLGQLEVAELRPRELVFVIDQSGSMAGEPYDVARAAVAEALRKMRRADTFNLVRFSQDADLLFEEAQPSTEATRAQAAAWLSEFIGGSTEMQVGLEAALRAPARPDSLRLVLLLTDGFVGDDDTIGRVVQDNLGRNRVFALGVSSSPNRSLLSRVAEMGRGAVLYHRPGASIARAVDTFYTRIDRPALTDVVVDWGGLDVFDTLPSRIPDLWAGQVLRVSGRFTPGQVQEAEVVVSGFVGRRHVRFPVTVDLAGAEPNPAVRTLWARRKVAELDARAPGHATGRRRDEIVDVAIEHELVTRYTSLVAVDDSAGDCGPAEVTVEAPNELPAGMSGGFALGAIGTQGYGSGTGVGYGQGHGTFGFRGAALAGRGALQPDVSEASSLVVGSLDKSLIADVITRNRLPIRYCYQRELQKRPSLAGTVRMRFTVAADGSVSTAAVGESTLGSPEVEDCLVHLVQRMQFSPVPGGGVVSVTYPFTFVAP